MNETVYTYKAITPFGENEAMESKFNKLKHCKECGKIRKSEITFGLCWKCYSKKFKLNERPVKPLTT